MKAHLVTGEITLNPKPSSPGHPPQAAAGGYIQTWTWGAIASWGMQVSVLLFTPLPPPPCTLPPPSGKRTVLDRITEFIAIRRDRSVFPMRLAVTHISGVGEDSIFMGVIEVWGVGGEDSIFMGVIEVWKAGDGGNPCVP